MTQYDFGILRFLRKQKGYTIDDLAKKSGVSFAVISKLERNRTNPGLSTLQQIGNALGISATEIVTMAEIKVNEMNNVNFTRTINNLLRSSIL